MKVIMNLRVNKFWCTVMFAHAFLTIGAMPTPEWLKRRAVKVEMT